MKAECYVMDLYCDCSDCVADLRNAQQFAGKKRGDCLQQARKRGWVISFREGNDRCPACSGKRESTGDSK